MTKMTHSTNLTIVVKLIDLDTNCIYSHNHMVGMDKISSSHCDYKILNGIPNIQIIVHFCFASFIHITLTMVFF
jgi:hypothetical protein